MLASRAIALGVAATILCYLFFFGAPISLPAVQIYPSAPADSPKPEPDSLQAEGSWAWNATQYRNDHALTHAQCDTTFPKLYYEIDRSAAFWKKKLNGQKIGETQTSLDWSPDGGMRVMIWEQQLYIVSSRGLNHFTHWRERSHGTLHQIHRALQASREPVPNIEFSVKINDNIALTEKAPNAAVWAFSRNLNDKAMEQVWLVPDFNFWTYPRVAGGFGDFQREAIEAGSGWEQKLSKLVWRGTIGFNTYIREPLLKQSAGKPWSDVHKVDEDTTAADQAKYRITLPEHCKYKFAVHTEGTTWSGRLKYLLSCHSAIFIHPLTYYTHLYHLLQPDGAQQNYVPVQMDWSDLSEKVEDLLQNKEKAEMIADNAASEFRDLYFTPAAQTCYWRRLFQTWAEMTEEPNPSKYPEKMTYEEYIFWDKDVPKPKD